MAIFVVCGYGATKVKIDSNLVELFKEGNPVRVAYEIVDEHMAGTGSMEVMMDFNASDAMSDPAVLTAISDLQDTTGKRIRKIRGAYAFAGRSGEGHQQDHERE